MDLALQFAAFMGLWNDSAFLPAWQDHGHYGSAYFESLRNPFIVYCAGVSEAPALFSLIVLHLANAVPI